MYVLQDRVVTEYRWGGSRRTITFMDYYFYVS